MRFTKAQKAILVTLSVIAIGMSIAAFTLPVNEASNASVSITPTPEVVTIEIKAVTTPVPPAPTLPPDMATPAPTSSITPISTEPAATQKPSSSVNVSGAFALGVDKSIVQIASGVEESILEKGPGWLESSAKPGQEGVCVIYGHRNRNHLKVLEGTKEGDAISVYTKSGFTYSYVVESVEILDSEKDIRIPALDGSHIMIATCYPFRYSGHAPQKFVVMGRLV